MVSKVCWVLVLCVVSVGRVCSSSGWVVLILRLNWVMVLKRLGKVVLCLGLGGSVRWVWMLVWMVLWWVCLFLCEVVG